MIDGRVSDFDKEMTFAETDEKDAQSKDEQAMKDIAAKNRPVKLSNPTLHPLKLPPERPGEAKKILHMQGDKVKKVKDFSMPHPKRAGKAKHSFHMYGVEQSPTLIVRMKPRLKTKMRKTKMKPRWKMMKPRMKKPKSKTIMKNFDNLSLDSSIIGNNVNNKVEQYVTLDEMLVTNQAMMP